MLAERQLSGKGRKQAFPARQGLVEGTRQGVQNNFPSVCYRETHSYGNEEVLDMLAIWEHPTFERRMKWRACMLPSFCKGSSSLLRKQADVARRCMHPCLQLGGSSFP